ncbi:hypothetical protein Aduo_018335 [Ancylostoma duodenale]
MSENSYRNGTGGGLDIELEKAINRGLEEMSPMDVSIARLLGKETSFLGHQVAESNVVAACPRSTSSSPSPVATPEELNRQLSNFDSLSEEASEDDDEPRGRHRRKSPLIREQLKLIKQQRELVRFQRMVLERENLMYIKMTEALTTFLENRSQLSRGRSSPDELVPHEVDPHLAESHISI